MRAIAKKIICPKKLMMWSKRGVWIVALLVCNHWIVYCIQFATLVFFVRFWKALFKNFSVRTKNATTLFTTQNQPIRFRTLTSQRLGRMGLRPWPRSRVPFFVPAAMLQFTLCNRELSICSWANLSSRIVDSSCSHSLFRIDCLAHFYGPLQLVSLFV